MLKEDGNRFFMVSENGRTLGEITYTNAGENIMIIDHTEVDSEFQGQGLAKELVLAVVEKARKNGKKVIPLCPFANAEFERNITYSDVRK